MHYVTPDLCDAYPDVAVVEPMFSNFGGHDSFGGQIVTVKCHEDNSIVKEQVDQDGTGKVMVVDGGGSLRRALLGDMLAEKAAKNGWEGIIVYGCVRDVDVLAQTALGIQALASHPMKTDKRGIGDLNVVVTFGGVSTSMPITTALLFHPRRSACPSKGLLAPVGEGESSNTSPLLRYSWCSSAANPPGDRYVRRRFPGARTARHAARRYGQSRWTQ